MQVWYRFHEDKRVWPLHLSFCSWWPSPAALSASAWAQGSILAAGGYLLIQSLPETVEPSYLLIPSMEKCSNYQDYKTKQTKHTHTDTLSASLSPILTYMNTLAPAPQSAPTHALMHFKYCGHKCVHACKNTHVYKHTSIYTHMGGRHKHEKKNKGEQNLDQEQQQYWKERDTWEKK